MFNLGRSRSVRPVSLSGRGEIPRPLHEGNGVLNQHRFFILGHLTSIDYIRRCQGVQVMGVCGRVVNDGGFAHGNQLTAAEIDCPNIKRCAAIIFIDFHCVPFPPDTKILSGLIPGRGRRVISLSEHDQIGFVGVQLICRRSTLGIADIQPGAAGCNEKAYLLSCLGRSLRTNRIEIEVILNAKVNTNGYRAGAVVIGEDAVVHIVPERLVVRVVLVICVVRESIIRHSRTAPVAR